MAKTTDIESLKGRSTGGSEIIGGERRVLCVNAGHIPVEQSRIFALAAWANDQERRLLRLHCGQMLDRSRHLAWAKAALQPLSKGEEG